MVCSDVPVTRLNGIGNVIGGHLLPGSGRLIETMAKGDVTLGADISNMQYLLPK